MRDVASIVLAFDRLKSKLHRFGIVKNGTTITCRDRSRSGARKFSISPYTIRRSQTPVRDYAPYVQNGVYAGVPIYERDRVPCLRRASFVRRSTRHCCEFVGTAPGPVRLRPPAAMLRKKKHIRSSNAMQKKRVMLGYAMKEKRNKGHRARKTRPTTAVTLYRTRRW
ncbi:hypothetical protein EVAR_52764_1 [Eumeta japonica]|uniref:Uncharacterized protein n=1 Tax=Eumeta variegata TaxID=151549 RepID=A0A4C1XGE4_EUMVA|nr:hypothetical protein EVAR_52764_1 [Eumeta japonica]